MSYNNHDNEDPNRVKYVREPKSKEIDYKSLLIEAVMRANLAFPLTEEQEKWFNEGHDIKNESGKDFFNRLKRAINK